MSIYDRLRDYLQSLQTDYCTLTFDEIEGIIGKKLPQSAHNHRPWWANQTDNENRPQAKAWMSAGWETENVDSAGKKVSFRRVTQMQSEEKEAAFTKTTPASDSTVQNEPAEEKPPAPNTPSTEKPVVSDKPPSAINVIVFLLAVVGAIVVIKFLFGILFR